MTAWLCSALLFLLMFVVVEIIVARYLVFLAVFLATHNFIQSLAPSIFLINVKELKQISFSIVSRSFFDIQSNFSPMISVN